MSANGSAATTPADTTLERLLQVQPAGVIRDTFVGAPRDYGPLRIYGGHLLGQGLSAALATVGEPMQAHSLHAYFLKTGAPDAALGYQVERLRDGRSYATRLVRAVQADQVLMIMTASFKVAEPGDEHQPAMAPAAAASGRRRGSEASLVLPFSAGLGIDLEPLGDWDPREPPASEPAISLWMRARLSGAAGPRARQCALAYLSDSTLMFNALRPHGTAFQSHRTTSLDHALWFHRAADPAAWLLFEQQGPVAADSRGWNQGRIFAADGTLIASAVQEALMRRQ